MTDHTAPTNPIIKSTALRAYPGWAVREYADGTFDSTNGVGLSPVEATFRDAVHFARTGEPAMLADPEAAIVRAEIAEEERLMREAQEDEIAAERRNEEALYGPTEAMLADYEAEAAREARWCL